MNKSYKYRIYPNAYQKNLLSKTFGCVRFVYNYYLDKKIKLYKESNQSFNYNQCSKDLTKLKNELLWLKEVDCRALQNSLRDLDSAYTNFFKLKFGFPKFKSKKDNKKSYKTQNINKNKSIQIIDNYIKISKLGKVKFKGKNKVKGRILSAIVSQSATGKYYISLCCDNIEIEKLSKTNKNVGLDLGIKNIITTSDNIKYKNHRYLKKSLLKIKKLQRELSRKTRGGSNWNKNRIKLAKAYEHITNQKLNYLHNISIELIRNYDVICIESLNIEELKQNHKLAQNICDVSWFEFIKQLKYKAKWYGKEIIEIDRFFPSSQICSNCGNKFSITKNLNIRKWICPCCKKELDRDINASINILNEGMNKKNCYYNRDSLVNNFSIEKCSQKPNPILEVE